MEETTRGREAAARKEEKGKRTLAKENPERVGRVARQDTLQLGVEKEKTHIYTPLTKTTVRTLKTENEEDLQAWCLLEESENEQWQEVTSKQNKRNVKKANQASLLSVENSHNSNPKKVVEVKDKWVKVRVSMDSGAAGHVMLDTMFSCVNLERKTSPKKFVAANGEQIKDLGEKNIPFKTNDGIQVHTTQKRECCQTLVSMQKVVRAGNMVVLDEKNPHIRNISEWKRYEAGREQR